MEEFTRIGAGVDPEQEETLLDDTRLRDEERDPDKEVSVSFSEEPNGSVSEELPAGSVVEWWSGDHKFLVTPTLHWLPEDRLTEGFSDSALCAVLLTLCTHRCGGLRSSW